MALLHKLVCVAAPYDLRLNRTKAVLLPKVNLHIYPSPVRISTERSSKTNRAAVAPVLYISYRCPNYVAIPILTNASSFATGRGSPYCFRRRPTSTHITVARRPLSLILGKVLFNGSTSCLFQPKALTVCPLIRDLSIAAVWFSFGGTAIVVFRINPTTSLSPSYIGGWLQTINPLKTPQIHPSQSGILLHGRANLSCSPRTDSFAISKRPCSIVHGEGWNYIGLTNWPWCLETDLNCRRVGLQPTALPTGLSRHKYSS